MCTAIQCFPCRNFTGYSIQHFHMCFKSLGKFIIFTVCLGKTCCVANVTVCGSKVWVHINIEWYPVADPEWVPWVPWNPLLKGCLRNYYAQTYYLHYTHSGATHFSFTVEITHIISCIKNLMRAWPTCAYNEQNKRAN